MSSSIPRVDPPFHILHIVNDSSLFAGGVGTVAFEMVKGQRNLGHHGAIWSIDSKNRRRQATSERILEEPADSMIFRTFGPRLFGFSPAMEKNAVGASARDFQLIHQHGIWLALSRVTNRWRSKYDRPTVIAPHGALEEFGLKRSKWKKRLAFIAYGMNNLKSASCLQATAEQEAISFRRFGLRNPIAIIPNGISEDWLKSPGEVQRFRKRFSIPHKRRLLLFLSRLHPKKGLPVLIEALAQLKHELNDWLLVVAGSDEVGHQHGLEQQIERSGLSSRILFVGPLHGPEKRDAFAAADVFVLPTHSENFGIVIAEALGAGVPVITTKGAPWEDLQTYKCGWWVKASADGVRDALHEATQRPKEELLAMGRRGKTLVSEKYTWQKVAEQSLRLYKWLLGRESLPGFVIGDSPEYLAKK
jgi:glycosyltransferase involved in cell wall biosynthesis